MKRNRIADAAACICVQRIEFSIVSSLFEEGLRAFSATARKMKVAEAERIVGPREQRSSSPSLLRLAQMLNSIFHPEDFDLGILEKPIGLRLAASNF